MTDDLDTLRPEIREAVAAIDKGNGVFVNGDDSEGGIAWATARAELLRLAKAEFDLRLALQDRLGVQDEYAVVAKGWQERAEKAEAELAALKARIAEAQKCSVVALCGGGTSLSHEPYDFLVGHRVALVKVEE